MPASSALDGLDSERRCHTMKGKTTRQEFAAFALALAVHVKGGERLAEACRETAGTSGNPALRAALLDICGALADEHVQPHEAFARHPEIFPEPFCRVVRVGMLSGNLWEHLEAYSLDLQRTAEILSGLRREARYPAIVGALAAAVIILLMLVVLPQMNDLYQGLERSGNGAPAVTRALLRLSGMLAGLPGLCLSVLVVTGMTLALRRRRK